MALTEYEQHLFFECIDIPNTTSVLYIDGAFGTGKTTATGAILVSRDLLIDRINGWDREKGIVVDGA